MVAFRSQIRDGMRVDWDVPISMDDGLELRCDIFRPIAEGRYPVIMAMGPYAKWMHYKDLFIDQWTPLETEHPEVLADNTGRYDVYEQLNPERFVPDGYVVIRIDSRGAGRSPGFLEIWSAREAHDYFNCIEWAATQPWSSGKIGLSGISYLAMNQWQVASLQPPHLSAMFIFEGAADCYRDMTCHGGIFCTFGKALYGPAMVSVQNGRGSKGYRSRITGDWVSGPDTLTEEELSSNRLDWYRETLHHKFANDEFWTSRMPDFSKINVPFVSAGNLGGHGLHLRGNVEGFMQSASKQKWLELHGLEHWTEYYTDYGVDLQKRFFGHFLKGEDTGWSKQPRVQIQVRHPGDRFVQRHEDEWPIARTQWTKLHLVPQGLCLRPMPVTSEATVTYKGISDGLIFLSDPLATDTEITGPSVVKLFVSSSTEDADIFIVLRAFSPDLKEVTFTGMTDPHTAITHGWLRASRRKLDKSRSLPHRPYHAHDEDQKLKPGEIVELDIEVLSTSVALPKGYRIGLAVRGKDYVYGGGAGRSIRFQGGHFTGVGGFRHDEGADRPTKVFNGDVTLHFGANQPAYIELPIVPPK
jgi:predicted acyl esterase